MHKVLSFGCGVLMTVPLFAQKKPSAALPAMAPTQSVSDLPSAHAGTVPKQPGQSRVTWDGSALTIHANGDGLSEIVRQVARSTGMKVTGGVPNDPVYGNYGPGPVQQVLTSLFDGLSVNMMLVNGSPTKPKDLILTARNGGPTPPSAQPVASYDRENEVTASPEVAPRAGAHTSPNSFQGPQLAQPVSNGANANGTPPVSLNGTTVNGTPVDANGTPQSPNGTRTPEQIFEELRKRQQQQTISPQ